MSTQAVEARSLSTLTALAANPPSYPRNPTHVRHEPLVLYIARVPGSRDVFLSAMKPKDKVVSAEDIQNSLYFIHVDHPEDARLVEPQSVENHRIPPSPTVARKAVPNSLAPPDQAVPSLPPRPSPPYPLSPAEDFANRQNVNAGQYSRNSPTTGPEYNPRRSIETRPFPSSPERPPLPSRMPTELRSAPGTCLTLIRRDPASGSQWNVASMEDPPTHEISSATLSETKFKRKTGAPLYITISNPGYSKFLRQPERPDLTNMMSDLSMQANRPANTFAPLPPQPSGIGTRADTVFRRRIWMEGSKYSGGGIGHRKLGSHDANIGRQSPRISFEAIHGQRFSMDAREPPHLTRDGFPYDPAQTSETQSNFRGYAFMSPWNGRCEFTTGANGGSLKCRHVITGSRGTTPLAMPVSELRFNLPSSSKATTPQPDENPKRSSFFHRPRHHRNQSSEMDLSLGQEYAGGGFGGKQAKLGKLIIEDEGLKMVDLLVAANMALWWRAYEKA